LELGEIIFQILGGQKNKLGTKKTLSKKSRIWTSKWIAIESTPYYSYGFLFIARDESPSVPGQIHDTMGITGDFRQILGLKSSAMAELTTRKV